MSEFFGFRFHCCFVGTIAPAGPPRGANHLVGRVEVCLCVFSGGAVLQTCKIYFRQHNERLVATFIRYGVRLPQSGVLSATTFAGELGLALLLCSSAPHGLGRSRREGVS